MGVEGYDFVRSEWNQNAVWFPDGTSGNWFQNAPPTLSYPNSITWSSTGGYTFSGATWDPKSMESKALWNALHANTNVSVTGVTPSITANTRVSTEEIAEGQVFYGYVEL